ncbi:hypothetical protein [Streptomyces umbrinus]|uniref:hypothetical protein n=1 Tax=Streptomyces umbrinus TaxID=67370 RepID=UPI003C2DB1E6
MRRVAVVGASVAGLAAAETLCGENSGGAVALIVAGRSVGLAAAAGVSVPSKVIRAWRVAIPGAAARRDTVRGVSAA